MLIDTTVVGLFGLVAVATAHEHWLKERDDVLPITGPLKAWVDQLPAKQIKRIEERLAPTLLVVGIATVVGPDIVVEMRERAKDQSARAAVSGAGRRSSAPPVAAAGGPDRVPGAANGHAGTAGGWHSSIPARVGALADYDA